MDLAKTLVRTVVRAFYTTEHVLIIDALAIHSTLTDADLAHLLGMQTKALRKICAALKVDGLISVQSRGEKKEGAPPSYSMQSGNAQPKERLFFRDWYYINFHRAIDCIKYRFWKLNRYIEQQGAPTKEKKDQLCPQCKSEFTDLEVIDTGFTCRRCGHDLVPLEETEGAAENESMKRLNEQMSRVLELMRQIDSTTVPENDFDTALRYYIPIERPDSHPGARTTIVDDRKPLIASSKGLAMAPEKISVNLTEEKVEDEKTTEQRRAERKEAEAKQNMLPEWISKSTLSGELTTVGAKELADRKKRDLESGDLGIADAEEEKKSKEAIEEADMAEYWREMRAAQEKERRGIGSDEDDEDEDEDEDDFEDVEGVAPKRVKLENGESSNGSNGQKALAVPNGTNGVVKDEAKVSDADDDDDDELEFEDV